MWQHSLIDFTNAASIPQLEKCWMSMRTTPLGFLPGDIDTGTHCMFIYNRKDDAFAKSIARYLSAGIGAGEMCVCLVDDHSTDRIKVSMAQMGLDTDSLYTSGQLVTADPSEIYMPDGRFNIESIIHYWTDKLDTAKSKWGGLRVFGDSYPVGDSRMARLKMLEYEAFINLNPPMNIALCGYESAHSARSFFLQAKSVHPYIANSRSIRRNPAYMPTSKFLAGFYRFRRVSKAYPATPDQLELIANDVEETTVRTPLTIPQIEDLKAAIAEVVHRISACGPGPSGKPHRIHVTLAPESDKFIVSLWGQGMDFPRDEEPSQSLKEKVDEVRLPKINGDVAVTLMKRYTNQAQL